MLTACWFLIAIGVLGAADIAWFHTAKGQLTRRPECRSESLVHVARGFVYAVQFLVVPTVRFHGAWYFALLALFVIDAAIAITDVLLEPKSRASQGGLAPAEYLMHIVLSVLVGALLHTVFSVTWGDWNGPTRLEWTDTVPSGIRALMAMMAAGSALVAVLEALSLWESTWPAPRPIHVKVRLRTSLTALWNLTQDHRIHPSWDHRFSRIQMLAPQIRTGTQMLYEKDLLGVTIRGFGRYKLHKPMQQSTFEFWSDDRRSLIRRGVGLWRYTPVSDGVIEFATSYTYEVRWGLAGRVIDRVVFRPVFQWFTEQSFARLARRYFPRGASPVLGAVGRRPAQFADARPTQLQPVQRLVPVPAVCLQDVTVPLHVSVHAPAPQVCFEDAELLAVKSHAPLAQVCVQVAPEPQVS